jgi:hypothetical protein
VYGDSSPRPRFDGYFIDYDAKEATRLSLPLDRVYNPLEASIQLYKNFSYADTLGSVFSAITQIGDLAWSLYENGWLDTSRAVARAALKKSRITKEDVGIERIAQEFADGGTLSNAVAKVFKWVGLEKMDTIGKESLLNASLESFEKRSAKDPAKLKKEIEDILPSSYFLRVQKSYIVHLNQILSFNTKEIYLKQGAVVQVGRQYYNSFLSKLNTITES